MPGHFEPPTPLRALLAGTNLYFNFGLMSAVKNKAMMKDANTNKANIFLSEVGVGELEYSRWQFVFLRLYLVVLLIVFFVNCSSRSCWGDIGPMAWLLVASLLVPRFDREWRFPPLLFWGSYVYIGASLTVEAIQKLQNPSWMRGKALVHLLNHPAALDTQLHRSLLSLPESLLSGASYALLAAQLWMLPFVLWQRTRLLAWTLFQMINFTYAIIFGPGIWFFTNLALGIFTFDGRWLEKRRSVAAPILFFDGVCGLCSAAVDFVMVEDFGQRIKFAPLQGEAAKVKLPKELTANLSTLVLWEDDRIYQKSAAVFVVLDHLGGIWKILNIFKVIPRSILDLIYDWVAKSRYRWFGRKETCRLPTPPERSRFID